MKPSKNQLPGLTQVYSKMRWQLFFTHLFVALLVWLLSPFFNVVFGIGNNSFSGLILGLEYLIIAGFIGLGLTFNLWRGLHKLERLLLELAGGQVNEPPAQLFKGRRNWPFSALVTNLETITTRITDTTFRFDRLNQARDQWIAQLGEAAAQTERNRLARELHDTVKQQLFSIAASVTSAQWRWETDPAGAKNDLATVRQLVGQAQAEMKALLAQLQPNPLETSGLLDALRDQAQALEYRSGVEVELAFSELPPADRLPAQAEQTIFRVAGEALNNVARHARASRVRLNLQKQQRDEKDWLVLQVQDNGQGFDPAQTSEGSMGLRGVSERAREIDAFVQVHSAAGQGTKLELWIPLIEPVTPTSLSQEKIAELEARANHITARLGWISTLAGLGVAVCAGIFLSSFFLNVKQAENNPLSLVKENLLWPIVALILVGAYYLYIRFTIGQLPDHNAPVTPKTSRLAFFQVYLEMTIVTLAFVSLPSVPTLLAKPADSQIANWIGLVAAVLLALLAFTVTLRYNKLDTLRYESSSSTQKAERLRKGRRALKLSWLYFASQAWIIGWIIFAWRPQGFPAHRLEDFYPDAMISLTIFSVIVQISTYGIILERIRQRPFNRRFWRTVLGVPISVALAGVLVFNLLVSQFQEITTIGISSGGQILAWSPDQHRITTLSWPRGELAVANLTSNSTISLNPLPAVLLEHTIYPLLLYWSDDSQVVNLVSSKDGQIYRWNGEHGDALPSLQLEGATGLGQPMLSKDHRQLLAHIGQVWGVWSLADGKRLRTVELNAPKYGMAAWSPNGQRIAFEMENGGIEVMSVADGHLLAQSNTTENYGQVNALEWSPDGQTIAAGYGYMSSSQQDSPVRLWNASDGRLETTLSGHNYNVRAVAWSPDGRYLVSSAMNEVRLWSRNGQPVAALSSWTAPQELAWSPDGHLVAGTGYGKLVLWKVNS